MQGKFILDIFRGNVFQHVYKDRAQYAEFDRPVCDEVALFVLLQYSVAWLSLNMLWMLDKFTSGSLKRNDILVHHKIYKERESSVLNTEGRVQWACDI